MDLASYLANRPRGFKARLARQLGVSRSFLRQMETGISKIPIHLAKKMESVTDGKMKKENLRPDIWD